VTIIDSLSEFEKLSDSWNELLTKASSNTVFLTWEWLYSWAEFYINKNRQLFVLAIYDRTELVGIAPCYIHHIPVTVFTLRQIEFLGTPETASDYLDIIIKNGSEREVTRCLYDYLLNDAASLWDCLMLRDIPSNSLFFLYFTNLIEEKGKYAEICRGSFCPTVSLPGKNEDFILQTSSHRRQRFNRDSKILHREGEIEHFSSSIDEDINKALSDYFSLYEEQKGFSANQFHLFLKKFASRCKNGNTLQIDLYSSNGKNIAGLLHLQYQDTLSLYLMATDKNFNPRISIGNVLVGLCIKRALSQGVSTYDFLKGIEPYKFYWANGSRSSVHVFFYQRKLMSILSAVRRFLKHTAKITLR
jgi:hypothetical protein